MRKCLKCEESIDYLNVKRVVEEICKITDEYLEVNEETIIDDRFYCPACGKCLFIHHADAEEFLADVESQTVAWIKVA